MSLLQSIPRIILVSLIILIIPTTSFNTLFPRANVPVAAQGETLFFIFEFSRNVLLSTDDDTYPQHVEPTLAISDNGTIFAGWKNSETHNGAGSRVSFAKSSDNGETWTEPFDMPMFRNLVTRQSDPWLVWHSNNLFYAYLEFSTSSDFSQITVAKSTDHAGTWTTESATYGQGFADKETMAVSNDGTIYVAYDDIEYSDDISETAVRLTRSDDNGDSFEEINVITTSSTDPQDHVGPYVTADSDNNVYVAWFRFTNDPWGDIYLTNSSDHGETFSQAVDINQDSENCSYVDVSGRPSRVTLPVIRFDQNDRLYALWAEKYEPEGLWDVYLRYSDDHGLNWSSRYQVNPRVAGTQWQPDMDIDSKGRVHVVWYDEQEGKFMPYYRMITFSEETGIEPVFSDPVAVANVNTSSVFTRPGDYFTVRVDSNDIPHVVWTDGRNAEMDIYYSHGILGQPLSTTTTSTSRETTSNVTTTTEEASTFEVLPVLIAFSVLLMISRRRKKK